MCYSIMGQTSNNITQDHISQQLLPSHGLLHGTREIGGYLDISANTPVHKHFFSQYALNAARFCLEYLIQERQYSTIWLPYYGCHTLAQVASKTGVTINYYEIDKTFLPIITHNIKDDPILYINYYGIMTDKCIDVTDKYNNVIIDNAQALYAPPITNCDCFYSPRKFFALPDGGIIAPGKPLAEPDFDVDISYERIEHIFRRIDCGAEDAYQISINNRNALSNSKIKKMSKLTKTMFAQIDVQSAAIKRKENWMLLHQELSPYNKLQLSLTETEIPLFYPFLFESTILRNKLNSHKIFTPTYWPGMEKLTPPKSFDMYLYSYMHPLTIDQRYSVQDMHYIAKYIKKIIPIIDTP